MIGAVYVRGDTLIAEHAPLNALVSFAYDLRPFQLSGGPAWAEMHTLDDSELFAVTAKAAGDPPPPMDVFRRMLQTPLADRFQLKVHHQQKEMPVYNLVLAKDGPRLRPSAPEEKFGAQVTAVGKTGTKLAATKVSISRLIDSQLTHYAGRPVFDKTGLTGDYDLSLGFTGENLPPGQQDPDAEYPSLSSAIGQLGLKLEPSRALFDTVVIDDARRPSEN